MVNYGGYWGKCLEVDMTTGSINVSDKHMQYVGDYIGGRMLGIRMLWDALKDKPGIDALAPETPLMFIPGVISGTGINGASRFVCVTKSPLTMAKKPTYEHSSTIAWGSMGSSFSPMIKWAGYDMIYVTGKSDSLKVLVIDNDEVKLEDASEYAQTKQGDFCESMQKKYGAKYKVIAVGPAAENGVRFASIESEGGRAVGRSGIGCVMGQKGLKGIVVYGDKAVPVACDHNTITNIFQKTKDLDFSSPTFTRYRMWGTQISLDLNNINGGKPKMTVRNWREAYNPNLETGGIALMKNFVVRHRGCNLCGFKCMKMGVVRDGEFAGLVADGPEYENGTTIGNWLLDNTDDIGATVHYIEELGMDTISTGGVVAFVLECYELGYITQEDLGGIKAEWGNASEIVKLLNAIAFDTEHEIFSWLRRGSDYAAAKIEEAKKLEKGTVDYYSITVKNHGLPAHGIQANWVSGHGIAYGTGERGACHIMGGDALSHKINFIEDCGVFCLFHLAVYGIDNMCEALNAVMGISLTKDQYLNIAEKAIHIANIFNHREGFRKEDTMLPSRIHNEPCQWGVAKGATYPIEEFNKGMKAFYEGFFMDWETMLPQVGRLEDLGLEKDIIDYVKSAQ